MVHLNLSMCISYTCSFVVMSAGAVFRLLADDPRAGRMIAAADALAARMRTQGGLTPNCDIYYVTPGVNGKVTKMLARGGLTPNCEIYHITPGVDGKAPHLPHGWKPPAYATRDVGGVFSLVSLAAYALATRPGVPLARETIARTPQDVHHLVQRYTTEDAQRGVFDTIRTWYKDGTPQLEQPMVPAPHVLWDISVEHSLRVVRHGTRKSWHANGQLYMSIDYTMGELNGVVDVWDSTGRLNSRNNYHMGTLHGEWRSVDRAKNLITDGCYFRGRKVGQWKRYIISSGMLVSERYYVDGKENGVRRTWNDCGFLTQIVRVVDGQQIPPLITVRYTKGAYKGTTITNRFHSATSAITHVGMKPMRTARLRLDLAEPCVRPGSPRGTRYRKRVKFDYVTDESPLAEYGFGIQLLDELSVPLDLVLYKND